MSEMIERVARSVAAAWGDDFDQAFANKTAWAASHGERGGRFRDINEPTQADFLEIAQAAIRAMREPSEAMWRAGYEVLCSKEMPPNPEEHWEGWTAPRVYRAMIDEALR